MKRKNTTFFFSNNIEVYTIKHSCTKQDIGIQTYIFLKKKYLINNGNFYS